MNYKVLVSILNWNSQEATSSCLASIARVAKTSQPDIAVIDNGSELPFRLEPSLKTKLSSIKVIRNPKNVGFAAGHNHNIRHAHEAGYDVVVLLNNDTEVIDKRLFSKLASALANRPQALGAGPTILSARQPDIIWYGGGFLSRLSGRTHHNKVGEVYRPTDEQSAQTSFITGGCLAINLQRASLDQLLLDERYFVYWEDSDWCLRARKNGFDLLYVADALILHHVSSSLGLSSPLYIYYNLRNRILFLRANFNFVSRTLGLFFVMTTMVKYKFNIIFRYQRGRWRSLTALWLGFIDGLRNIEGESERKL